MERGCPHCRMFFEAFMKEHMRAEDAERGMLTTQLELTNWRIDPQVRAQVIAELLQAHGVSVAASPERAFE